MVSTGTINFYGTDDGIYMQTEGKKELLCGDIAKNLNVGNGRLYYTTTENGCPYIKVIRIEDEVVEKSFALTDFQIKHMYLVSQNRILFSAGGRLYQLNLETNEIAPYREYTDIFSFIPTPYGILYATGTLFDYRLYAEGTWIAEQVSDYDIEGGILCYTKDGESHQSNIASLFGVNQSKESFEEVVVCGNGMEEVSVEEFLEEIGNTNPPEESASQGEATEPIQPIIASTEAEELITLQIYEEYPIGINPMGINSKEVASQPEPDTGGLIPAKINPKQQACKDKAYKIYNTTWTTLKDMKKYNDSKTTGVIAAGTLIHGIVYGQPVSNGKFILYGMSFEEYLKEVKNPNSLVYSTDAKDVASNNETNMHCAKYSTDCSTFASYCWGLGEKQTTANIPGFGVLKCVYKDPYSFKGMQTGDVLNYHIKGKGHVIVIVDIQYDTNGNIGLIETIEQTPDCTKKTSYTSLGNMKDKINGIEKYILYRCKTIPDSTGLVLSKTSLSLHIGETQLLTATGTPGGKLTWSSSNPAVATVDAEGTVTAKKAGSAKIKAKLTVEGVDIASKECALTVKAKTLSLNKTSLSIYKGNSEQLIATPAPATTVVWKSSDTSIATVKDNGAVTGIKVGKATITATAHGLRKTCAVTVKAPTFSLKPIECSMYLGETKSITATPAPATTVVWKSSDTSIATVKDNGAVTGIKVGTTTITATASGLSRSCKVKVELSTLSVTEKTISVRVGKKVTITAKATPKTTIQYRSEAPIIATVDAAGMVTGKRVGSTQIVVTANGSTKKIKVTVK